MGRWEVPPKVTPLVGRDTYGGGAQGGAARGTSKVLPATSTQTGGRAAEAIVARRLGAERSATPSDAKSMPFEGISTAGTGFTLETGGCLVSYSLAMGGVWSHIISSPLSA